MNNRWFLLALINSVLMWACVALALVLSSCAGRAAPHASPTGISVKEQMERAVRIDTACFSGDLFVGERIKLDGHMGTGVILDDGHVLTARHVVRCDDGVALIHVQDMDGVRRVAIVEQSSDHDVARLRVMVPYYAARPAPIARAEPGESVCSQTAIPDRLRSCGKVMNVAYEQIDDVSVDVTTSALVVSGNSGSGMWDSSGRLVCIVTHSGPSGGMCSSVATAFPPAGNK